MIKKFHTFIKENHLDVDPYGEEDWNDENEIHEGDIVICIDDYRLFTDKIKLGVNYEVIDITQNHVTLKGIWGWWLKKRFKKDTSVNENHERLRSLR